MKVKEGEGRKRGEGSERGRKRREPRNREESMDKQGVNLKGNNEKGESGKTKIHTLIPHRHKSSTSSQAITFLCY
jgi:hypothetical protein